MRKYPIVRQSGLKDCGVSCMLMLIQFYKGNVSLEYLRDLTKTTKKGTTAYHIIEGMKQLGFNSYGIRCSLDDLYKDNVVLPLIAHMVIDEKFYHFVVIYEINYRKKRLLIADPSSGIKKISFSEFTELWSGVIIINYPVQKIINEKPPINFISFITSIINKYRKDFTPIVILSLFVMTMSVLTSFFLQYMIDAFNISMNKNHLITVWMFFIGFYFIRILSDYFRNELLIYVNQKIDVLLTIDVFKKVIYLPYQYYSNRTTGEVVSRLNDLGLVRSMLSRIVISGIIDLPLTILSSIVMYFINPSLFFITIAVFSLYLLIIYLFRVPFNNYVKSIQEKRAIANSYMIESISGVNTVKGTNMEGIVVRNFEKKYISLLKDAFSFEKLLNLQYILKEIVSHGSYIIIILIGSFLVIDGEITLGSLLTFTALLNFFLNPIRNLIDLDTDIRDARSALSRVLELSEYRKENGNVSKLTNGHIVVSNLSYSYDEVNNQLEDINLKIDKGNKVMITGPTGCGKSTLLKLLMKYQSVKRGMIKIGGIDINDYSSDAIKKGISYVSQQETLFTDTLHGNLSIHSSREIDVLRISEICCVNQIIKNDQLGYNTFIEENGFNFSGGEKQRIVLARTLLKKFDILLIDEGLNQVDLSLERTILKNVFTEFIDKTIIVVSHRNDNKDLFDQVIDFNELKNPEVLDYVK